MIEQPKEQLAANQEPAQEAEPVWPHIYVTSEHDADGTEGRWLDATERPEQLEAHVAEIVAAAPPGGPLARYAVLAHIGFEGIRLGEHEPLDRIAALARSVILYGPAFARWAQAIGVTEATENGFRGSYLGSWADLHAFGRDFAADLGLEERLRAVPADLAPYVGVDTDKLVDDMLSRGEIETFEDGIGVTHVFLGPSRPTEGGEDA